MTTRNSSVRGKKDVAVMAKTYEEIANKLNCKTKSVDTAMTRIRRKANKIKKQVDENENN